MLSLSIKCCKCCLFTKSTKVNASELKRQWHNHIDRAALMCEQLHNNQNTSLNGHEVKLLHRCHLEKLRDSNCDYFYFDNQESFEASPVRPPFPWGYEMFAGRGTPTCPALDGVPAGRQRVVGEALGQGLEEDHVEKGLDLPGYRNRREHKKKKENKKELSLFYFLWGTVVHNQQLIGFFFHHFSIWLQWCII